MSKPTDTSHSKLLHHLGAALGFVGLILWYYIGERLGLTVALSHFFPSSHSGVGLMLGIMLVMTPGFFVWKFYNRWLERKLSVKGRYYEDEYYGTAKHSDEER